jgi:hypothetical protein
MGYRTRRVLGRLSASSNLCISRRGHLHTTSGSGRHPATEGRWARSGRAPHGSSRRRRSPQTALIHGLTWANVRFLMTSPAILRAHAVPMVRTTPNSRIRRSEEQSDHPVRPGTSRRDRRLAPPPRIPSHCMLKLFADNRTTSQGPDRVSRSGSRMLFVRTERADQHDRILQVSNTYSTLMPWAALLPIIFSSHGPRDLRHGPLTAGG